jgi:hypothetical protein
MTNFFSPLKMGDSGPRLCRAVLQNCSGGGKAVAAININQKRGMGYLCDVISRTFLRLVCPPSPEASEDNTAALREIVTVVMGSWNFAFLTALALASGG